MKKHSAEIFFTLGLIGVFFVTSIMVIIIGIQSFRNINQDIRKTYNIRTSLAYIQEKVRQMDTEGTIGETMIQDEKGTKIPALTIHTDISGVTFVTYIYAYDHTLRELLLRESYTPKAENGTSLTELESFIVKEIPGNTENEESTYKISMIDKDGKESILLIHPYSQSRIGEVTP